MAAAASVPGESGDGSSSRPREENRRVYQDWQGNETFFCWGHLVAGPNWRASLGSAFLLLAPSGVFLALVAPYVARQLHVIILVVGCILPVLAVLFLFLTACRDPGIIPRQEPDDEYRCGRKPRSQEVMVNGHRVIIRYNETCHFYQPPRAHHCSVNDNCIERFDHHCPWVGTTIGKRNYRTFLLLIFTSTILCLYVMGVSLAQLFLRHKELADEDRTAGGSGDSQWGKTVTQCIPALVLLAYSFLFSWFVGGLSGFHCYLVATNQTTYENFRYNRDNHPNPFDRGIIRNCMEVWCMRIPPSQVDFRAYVSDPKPAPSYQPPRDVEMTQAGSNRVSGSTMGSDSTHTSAQQHTSSSSQRTGVYAPAGVAAANPLHHVNGTQGVSHEHVSIEVNRDGQPVSMQTPGAAQYTSNA